MDSAATSAPPPHELQPPPQPPTAQEPRGHRIESCHMIEWQYEKYKLKFAPMVGSEFINALEKAYQAYQQGGEETTIIPWDWGENTEEPARRKGLQYLARGRTCQNKI